jgi:hypothetical protein
MLRLNGNDAVMKKDVYTVAFQSRIGIIIRLLFVTDLNGL